MVRNLGTLALGAFGGWLFWLLHLPLPWMLGAILTTTLAALAGVPIAAPRRLRPAVVAVIGVLLGSGFKPDLVAHLPDMVLAAGLLVLYLLLSAVIVIPFYRRFGGFDPVTAYFAAMPGGLTEMVTIGGAAGGDERKIILAHAARIFICVFLIAFWFRVVQGMVIQPAPLSAGLAQLSLFDAVLLGGAALIGVPLARLARLPAPELIGPMVLSAAIHLTNLTELAPPTVLVISAQVVLGSLLGCRFVGSDRGEVLRALGLAFGATFLTLLIALASAQVAGRIGGYPPDLVLLAYAPGGLSEMSLIALAMQADVAFVAIQHILRIVLVVAGAPLVFALLRRGKN